MPHELSEAYEVPGLGPVYFRRLTEIELHRFMMPFAGNHAAYWSSWVAAAAVDADDNPIFTKDDIPRLEAMPAHVVQPMGRFAARFNGFNA